MSRHGISSQPVSDMSVNGNLIVKKEIRNKELEGRLKKLEDMVESLVEAQNESRDQIQALLDYCFTDRSRWKEGPREWQREGQSDEDTLTLRCTSNIEDERKNINPNETENCVLEILHENTNE